MKNLICFLFLMISFSLYADDSQIILDPLEGIRREAFIEEKVSRQLYVQECTIKKVSEGYSESCEIEEESEEEADVKAELEVGEQPNSESQESVNILEMLEMQSPYSKECAVSLSEDGFYIEICKSLKEEEDLYPRIFSKEEYTQQKKIDWEELFSLKEAIVVPELVEKATDGVGRIVGIFIQNRQETNKENTSSEFFSVVKGEDEDGRLDISRKRQIMGSGFFIRDDVDQSVLVSNYHVVEAMLLILFQMEIPDQDWFSETSEIQFYVEQGDQKFRIAGIRDMSRLMDLAVLEVEGYTNSTLTVADHYANEVPAYILGYPGGDFQKVKATNAFVTNKLRTSFMVSHNIDECWSLDGMSGSPTLNVNGEVVGVTSAASSCRHVEIVPLEGFNDLNLMSSVKDNTDSIIDLILGQEVRLYDQWISNAEDKRDLAWIVMDDDVNSKLLSYIVHSLNEDFVLNIYQKLFSSRHELDEQEEKVYKFLLQRQMAHVQELNFSEVAQLGDVIAKLLLGIELYQEENLSQALQLFQELVQSRNPLHLYQLSQLYYEEENLSQACRLLTYAKEPVEALDDLYQEYECDGVLSGT